MKRKFQTGTSNIAQASMNTSKFDFSLLGKDVERNVICLIIHARANQPKQINWTLLDTEPNKQKKVHELRLVCKRWKMLFQEIGACSFCKDDSRIRITYTVSDRFMCVANRSTDFCGNLYLNPTAVSTIVWNRNYNYSTHVNYYLDNNSKNLLREYVQAVLSNPTSRKKALWSSSVSKNFEERFPIAREESWKERLQISTPKGLVIIKYYSHDQYLDEPREFKEHKIRVNRTLAYLWASSKVKDPRTKAIPEYMQLLTLRKIIQECFCRFGNGEVICKDFGSITSPLITTCTTDISAELANFDLASYQKQDYNNLKELRDLDEGESSEESSSSGEEDYSDEDDDDSDGSDSSDYGKSVKY